MKNQLLAKLEELDEKVSLVEKRSPEVVQAYREKLETKVHELLEDSQIDDNRIAAEVVLFSDKICNDERNCPAPQSYPRYEKNTQRTGKVILDANWILWHRK